MLNRRRPRFLAALAMATTALLTLSACFTGSGPSGDDTTDSARPTTESGVDAPRGLEDFYGQAVKWTNCGGGFECTRIEVPLDYAEPDGDRIDLSLKKLRALRPTDRLGSLVINPGGPGGSGISLVESADQVFSSTLRNVYDIVGFDPRGVGASTPVECLTDPELDDLRAAVYDTATPQGRDLFRQDMIALADACQEKSGDLLAHVDTVSAARDLDVIRAVLGQEQLDYLGYSYGTFLGATYAELFPEQAGRMVLDGAIDPSLSYEEVALGQARGFETALRAYAEDCLSEQECPLSGSVDDAVGQVRTFLELLAGSPLETSSDRVLTQSLGFSGLLVTLYDDRYWPLLSSALSSAVINRDGSQFLFLADVIADRKEDGTYTSNSSIAITAVNCLDYPVNADPAAMDAAAAALREASPTFGQFLAYGEIVCDVWPVDPEGSRGPLTAEGAGPILVIGTTGDPATPYEWAVSLAGQLESGRLLTFDGQGHTAYGRANSCVHDAVDAYLLTGELPEDGQTC